MYLNVNITFILKLDRFSKNLVSKSNAGFLGCQQKADTYNEIPYNAKNGHIDALHINEVKYQINKLFWRGETQEAFTQYDNSYIKYKKM